MIETKEIMGKCLLYIFFLTVLIYYEEKYELKIGTSQLIFENQNTLPFTLNAFQSNFSNAQAKRYCERIGMKTANANEIKRYYTLNMYKFSNESPAFTIGQNIDLELNSYYPKVEKYDFNTKQDNYTLCVSNDILQKNSFD